MNEATTTEIANTEQAAAWNGEEGRAWTEQADSYNRAGDRHWQRLLDAGRFRTTDRVLDVGCGTGKSSRDVARVVADGEVVGLDLSAPMLELGRSLAATDRLTNVKVVEGYAQVHPFDAAAFDVVISSFGAIFFGDPEAAFSNIGRALRPGGRLALLTWQDLRDNERLMALREVFAMGSSLPFPPPDAPTPSRWPTPNAAGATPQGGLPRRATSRRFRRPARGLHRPCPTRRRAPRLRRLARDRSLLIRFDPSRAGKAVVQPFVPGALERIPRT